MLTPVQSLCATEPDDPSDASARGTRDTQRLALAHPGHGLEVPGGMPAVLRARTAQLLPERVADPLDALYREVIVDARLA